nr:MAG TPA: hypothetical protein [Caudoviricetes sp.]
MTLRLFCLLLQIELETLYKRYTPVRCVFLCISFFDLVLCKSFVWGCDDIYK